MNTQNRSVKNKKIVSLVLLLIYVGCIALLAQNEPRKYIAFKALDSIKIDGIASESSWKNVSWSEDFIDIEGVVKPLYNTKMKMLWDDSYFYFYAEMEEPHVWGTLKQRDTIIFYNNDFEIFIDSDGDTHDYMEFEMNALNTVWDLFLTKPYRNGPKVLDSWDMQGLKTAVHINGTINDSSDLDRGWSVEIAIPWSTLVEANVHGRIPEEEYWRINFSRVNWQYSLREGIYSRKKDKDGKYLPEYNWVWSPQGVINMHEPEHWGYVYFSNSEIGTLNSFEISQDEHIKRYMYGLYRKLFESKDNFEKVKNEISGSSKTILGEKVNFDISTYDYGWSIWAKSPFTSKKLVIKEDGKFISYKK